MINEKLGQKISSHLKRLIRPDNGQNPTARKRNWRRQSQDRHQLSSTT